MCQAKRNRNNQYLAKVLKDVKTKQKTPSSTPTNSPKKSISKAPHKNTAKKRHCLRKEQLKNWLSPENVHIMTSLPSTKKLTGDIFPRGGIYIVRNV